MALLLVATALASCGDHGGNDAPYREEIPAERLAKGATVALPPRDTPLEEGEVAPAFPGLPEGKTVVLFFRGHW
jgi:hypothetical protein